MKLRIVIDMDVSPTIAETMKRNGFTVCQDGSTMQVKVPNCPAITKRKTRITFLNEEQIENEKELKSPLWPKTENS